MNYLKQTTLSWFSTFSEFLFILKQKKIKIYKLVKHITAFGEIENQKSFRETYFLRFETFSELKIRPNWILLKGNPGEGVPAYRSLGKCPWYSFLNQSIFHVANWLTKKINNQFWYQILRNECHTTEIWNWRCFIKKIVIIFKIYTYTHYFLLKSLFHAHI